MTNEKNELGRYLKCLRQAKHLTLRAVQEETGISNAYLSQLESGRTKQPSPVVLHKLAEIYSVAYEELMERAGYPVPNAEEIQTSSGIKSRLGDITSEEEEALLEYLSFLRRRRKTK